MALRFNVYGQLYDDCEPCFMKTVDGQVYNRATRTFTSMDLLQAAAAQKNHEWGDNEIGVPSAEWQAKNDVGPGIAWASDGTPPSVAPNPIKGPFSHDGVQFWINSENGSVGFDLDDASDVDVWVTVDEVCDGDLTDAVKIAISGQLVAAGCPKLPCVLASGKEMTKAYLAAKTET